METGFARAKTVYQELRAALTPWSKASGFRRWSGTPAGWCKAYSPEQVLGVRFECGRWASGDTGNSLSAYIELVPSSNPFPGNPVRQSSFTQALTQAELDQLARIHGAINRRRPPLPEYLEKDAREDSLMGHHLRQMYETAPAYREGEYVPLAYHSIADVQDLAGFVASVLPDAIARFLGGRVPKPVSTTPPHLMPDWLKQLPQ